MSSFASQVKNELVHVLGSQTCCKWQNLPLCFAWVLQFLYSKHDFGINFVTENAAVARKYYRYSNQACRKFTLKLQ